MKKFFSPQWLICSLLVALIAAGAYSFIDIDGDGSSFVAGDCQPMNKKIGNKVQEISFDSIDQNCDGKDYVSDDTFDNDKDGVSKVEGDCADDDSSVSPKSPEVMDGKDNDCDGRVDEKTIKFELIKLPTISPAGAKLGLEGTDFLRAISASRMTGDGIIYGGTLKLIATTKSPIAPNSGSKSVAVKIYLASGNGESFVPLDERFLDASWRGNGKNNLNTDNAGTDGGVFFAGQVRELNLDLSSLPVSAKSFSDSEKDSIDLVSLMKQYQQRGLILGFFTSAPGFGKINSASIELEVDSGASVNFSGF